MLVGTGPAVTGTIAATAAAHGWTLGTRPSFAGIDRVAGEIVLHIAGDLPGGPAPCVPAPLPPPVVAIADVHGDWLDRGYDAAVDPARIVADLPRVVADWCHAERLAVLFRLRAAFGPSAIARLLHGLRELIDAALAERDDAARAAAAHRLAGLAGTLGFAALGRQWLRVAEGRGAMSDAVRRASAHALLTLTFAKDKGLFTES